jgi:hypothetical protein
MQRRSLIAFQPKIKDQMLALAQALVEAQAQALVEAETQAGVEMQADAVAQLLTLAEALTMVMTLGQALGQALALGRVRARAETVVVAKALGLMLARALGQVLEQALEAEAKAKALRQKVETKLLALEREMAQARQLKQTLERELERAVELAVEVLVKVEAVVKVESVVKAVVKTLTLAMALVKALVTTKGTADTFTYAEVLADPKLKKIIYAIEPDYRFRLARHIPRYSQYHWLTQIVTPVTRLPPELLQRIFFIIIDEASDSPLVLMRVCKHWYTIVTGIWSSLKLGTTTPKDAVTSKLERNQWFLDILVDTESDRGDSTPSEGAYEGIFAAIEAASRWRSFIVETFPAQADLPEHLLNHGLQRSSGTVMSRLRIFKLQSACETSPLLDHILRNLGTTASEELTTIEINSANVISFLVPTHSSIFHSVRVLSLDTPGLLNPVDLLTHLHQLETLSASHLPLPVYHNDVNLPFVRTLRHLTLRSVSIQWMSGRTFDILESCTLLFPLHRHVLHTFRTTLPNCKYLTFEGYPLSILEGISARNISRLSVRSSCSNKLRGNRQLARFSSRALREDRLAPQILHISIEATNQAWIKSFAFMSNLEELVIDNAQPSSVGAKVLQSLVVHPAHANNLDTTVTPGKWDTPVCPSLKRFGLRYRRWLRPSEQFDSISVFAPIIWSRQQSTFSLQSFRIWTKSDQKDPLELLEGLQISRKGFERLANDCAISIENLLQLVPSGLVENIGVGQAEVGELLRVSGFTSPSSPPTADFILRTPVSSANDLALLSPGGSPETPETPSASSFHSAGAAVHHHTADLNDDSKEGLMVSSRRSSSSRRPSISSPVLFEQQAVRTLEHLIGSPARTNVGLTGSNSNGHGPGTDPSTNYAITQVMSRVFSWFKW